MNSCSFSRVTTCVENLEMSGNLTAVSEMSGILLIVTEKILSKNLAWNCLLLAVYLHPFLTLLSLCISFWFRIMHCCIPTPTTDNNTSTGMIWVTLKMGRRPAVPWTVREMSPNFTLSGEWSPCFTHLSDLRCFETVGSACGLLKYSFGNLKQFLVVVAFSVFDLFPSNL